MQKIITYLGTDTEEVNKFLSDGWHIKSVNPMVLNEKKSLVQTTVILEKDVNPEELTKNITDVYTGLFDALGELAKNLEKEEQ